MGRRTVLLIASILVAAVGTALIFMYVKGADDRANAKTQQVSVVVASKAIPQGQTITDSKSSLLVDNRPEGILPKGAYYSGNAGYTSLTSNGSNVALVDIPAGAVIYSSFFGTTQQVTASGLGKNQVEIAIQVTDPNRVAGALKPGSKVTIIDTTDPATYKDLGLATSGPNADKKVAISGALMNGVQVLRVGSNSQSNDSSSSETVDTKIISLAVSPCQALLLRAGEKIGELSFAIQGSDSNFVLQTFPQILAWQGKTKAPYCDDPSLQTGQTPLPDPSSA